MTFMTWTPKMSVGLRELDDDHKKLIRIINQLADHTAEEARATVTRQCLTALRRYAEVHFAREESVMSACKFLHLSQHKDEHRRFIEQIKEIGGRFDADPENQSAYVNEELLAFLRDWLNHHILIEDKAYQPFVENRPEARKAARAFRSSEIWWSG